MAAPDNLIDLIFWPLVIFAAVVAIFVAGFVTLVMVMARRSPGHHPQVSGQQGTNTYDASSHTMIQVREVNVNSPQRAPEDE
jgi:heme/copper-type cytochrome/quinol oxidase subunit 2